MLALFAQLKSGWWVYPFLYERDPLHIQEDVAILSIWNYPVQIFGGEG